MQIIASRKELVKALAIVAKVAPRKSPKPILTHALLSATNGGVYLTGTDLEIGVRVEVEGQADIPGAVVVSIAQLSGVLKGAKAETVRIDSNDSGDVAVSADGGMSMLATGHTADEFPTMPTAPNGSGAVMLAAGALARTFERTTHATDPTCSARYALSGVMLEYADGLLSAVATDGKRLARHAERAETNGGNVTPDRNPILPVKACKAIVSACKHAGAEAPARVAFLGAHGGSVIVEAGAVRVFSLCVEGRFPNYRDVYPAGYAARVTIADHTAVVAALAAALPIAEARDERQGKPYTAADFIVRAGTLSVVVAEDESAEAIYSARLPVAQAGPDVAYRASARLLLDALKSLGTKPVALTLDVVDHKSPSVWQTADGWDLLQMPIAAKPYPASWPAEPTNATLASRKADPVEAPAPSPAKPKRTRKPRTPKVAALIATPEPTPEPTPEAVAVADPEPTLPSLETAGATHSADAAPTPDGADAYAPYVVTIHGCPTLVSETTTADDVFPADPETIDAPGEPLDAPGVTPAGWEAVETSVEADAPCCGPAEAEPCKACETLAPPAEVFGERPVKAPALHAALTLTIADKRGERRYGLSIRSGSFLLESDKGDVYEVTETLGMVSCSCPDFQHRAWADREGCRHVRSLRLAGLLPPAPTVDPEPDPTPGEEWTMPTDRETILAEAFDRAEAPALVAVIAGSPDPEPTADEPPTPLGGFSEPVEPARPIPTTRITFLWKEGRDWQSLAFPLTIEPRWGLGLWETARTYLALWSREAPRSGHGYDKCKVEVEWADGHAWAGRADLQADDLRETNLAGLCTAKGQMYCRGVDPAVYQVGDVGAPVEPLFPPAPADYREATAATLRELGAEALALSLGLRDELIDEGHALGMDARECALRIADVLGIPDVVSLMPGHPLHATPEPAPEAPKIDYGPMDRAAVIRRIKVALETRSGKKWSVTGGKGTAYGWLTIDAPPARRTWTYHQTRTPEPPVPGAEYRGVHALTPLDRVEAGAKNPITSPADDSWAREEVRQGREVFYNWEFEAPGGPFGHMSPADRVELGRLLGCGRAVHFQGARVPDGWDHYREWIDRAEGRTPATYGERHWD